MDLTDLRVFSDLIDFKTNNNINLLNYEKTFGIIYFRLVFIWFFQKIILYL